MYEDIAKQSCMAATKLNICIAMTTMQKIKSTLYPDGDKSYTWGGNISTLSKVTFLQWVAKAWKSVTEDVVCKSFKACTISVKSDGSQDAEIHYLKRGCIAEDAVCEIRELIAALRAESSDDEDLFGDLDGDDNS